MAFNLTRKTTQKINHHNEKKKDPKKPPFIRPFLALNHLEEWSFTNIDKQVEEDPTQPEKPPQPNT